MTDHAQAIRDYFDSLAPHFDLERWEIVESRDEIMKHADALAAERDALRDYARALEAKVESFYGSRYVINITRENHDHAADLVDAGREGAQ